MATPSNQPLPSKEAALFRQVVRLYETKQYKKAIKAADQILKKFPDHGETLAMKGLTLKYMDRKEEAYDLVRKGLKADLKSHVCWHVYGLLYRSDMNYMEALKCYLNALRIDKDNIQILRDTALLQIQMRDIAGFVETRYKLLTVKPNNRNHWIAFAVGHHLEGNYEVAVQIMNQFETTLEEIPASEAYEHSELLFYKAQVMREGGQPAAALTLLAEQRDRLRDPLGFLTEEASLNLQLGNTEEAAGLYRKLLALNPDNYDMHVGLQASLGVAAAMAVAGKAWQPYSSTYSSSSGGSGQQQQQRPHGEFWHGGKGRRRLLQNYSEQEREVLQGLYEELIAEYPKSAACQRIPLDFKVGADFEAAAEQYVQRYVNKGIPSLFADLKPLYADADKAAALGRLFEGMRDKLVKEGAAAGNSSSSSSAANGISSSSSDGEDNPLTWVYHYLAQHYDKLGQTAAALEAADAALALAPEVVELYSSKAKILRHAGDVEGAAYYADQGRLRDLSDRYINSMAVKAMFKAGRSDEGEKLAALFTRDAIKGEQSSNLYDMQHTWYEVHAGEAHLASKQYGPALKKFLAVQSHFVDIGEDQFDFHSYCIRKMTLRSYVAMLRMEDHLYDHPFFLRAAWGAVRAYLDLIEAPAAAKAEAEAQEAALAALSPEERKREKLRRKKEEKRREAERVASEEAEKKTREAAAAGSNEKGKKKSGPSRPPDEDPHGAKLAATEDPLGEATKLVEKLKSHCSHHLLTQLAAFEVYSRRGKLLLALSAVQRGVEIAGSQDPEVAVRLVRLALQVAQNPPENPVVKEVISSSLPKLLGSSKSAADFAAAYKQQHGSSSSLLHRAAAAEMEVLVNPSGKAKTLAGLVGADDATAQGWSHKEAVAVHQQLLKGPMADAAAAAEWKQQCSKRYKWSRYFGGEDVVEVPAADGKEAAAAVAGVNGTASAVAQLSISH